MTADDGRHRAFLASDPSPRLLEHVATELGLGALQGLSRLTGGIDAAVHRAEFAHGTVVLRRFDVGLSWHSTPRVVREIEVLDELSAHELATPRVLLADVDGSVTGCPVIVQSLLPGRTGAPRNDRTWIRPLAQVLAEIHRLPIGGPVPTWAVGWSLDEPDAELLAAPRADEVLPALARVRPTLVAEPTGFTHQDFHNGNTLRRDGVVTGVVDWPHAGTGHPGFDVAYCAMDLALCVGGAAGEVLVDEWESAADTTLHPGWRLAAATRAMPHLPTWLPGWTEIGMDVTLDQVQHRLDDWIDVALRAVR